MFNQGLQQILDSPFVLLEFEVAFEDIWALVNYHYYSAQLQPNVGNIADRVPIGWLIDAIPYTDTELFQNQRQTIYTILTCNNFSGTCNTILLFLPIHYILNDLSCHD